MITENHYLSVELHAPLRSDGGHNGRCTGDGDTADAMCLVFHVFSTTKVT